MPQGSDKQCKLTPQGLQKLEEALEEQFGDRPSDSLIGETYSLDRDTVAKIRNGNKASTRGSIDRLFSALDLDLLEVDYERLASTRSTAIATSNPFDRADLWGCDGVLRQIFERLDKGGSQALVGPTGCGKSEILRSITQAEKTLQRPVLQLNMHLVRDERSFFDRLCDCFEFEPDNSLSRVPRQIERELKRRKQAHILCLDEIHVLTNEEFFPEATRNWLRGMADATYPLQLVVASQRELRQLFPDHPTRSSPLADFFAGQTVELQYWSLEKVERFVSDRLAGTGTQFDRPAIAAIYQQSGGQPKRVRELARELYDRQVAR